MGNGGDVVFCGKSKVTLLDFYEARVDLKTKEKKHLAIAETQFSQLKEVAPRLADQYSKRLKEIEFKDNIKLTDIKDSLHLFEPLEKNCHIYQIAIRKPIIQAGEKRFLIRKDLWNQLTPVHKAGLLSHEIIYEHLSKLGETDSIKARKLNTLLYSANVKKQEFWKLIKDLELPIYPQ